MLKKFFRWLARTFIVFILVSLVFSGVSFNLNSTLKGLFGDVFSYASKNAQAEAMSRMLDTCASVKSGAKLVSMSDICSDITLLDRMKENCRNYEILKSQGSKADNAQEIEQSCAEIQSGEIERTCENSKGIVSPNLDDFGGLCLKHESGEIDDKTFFAEFLSSPLGNQQMDLPQVRFYERMNNINTFLNSNLIIYLGALIFFIVALYILSSNPRSFAIVLGGACFSAGLIVLMPYAVIIAYDSVFGIDTTFILNSIYSYGTMVEPKSITSLVLLLFLKMYNTEVLAWGAILLSIGIGSAVFNYIFKGKKPEHY